MPRTSSTSPASASSAPLSTGTGDEFIRRYFAAIAPSRTGEFIRRYCHIHGYYCRRRFTFGE